MTPLRVLSLGWGVQSWTLAAMAALGEIEIDVALHSDTYWEKDATYAFIEKWTPWLEEHGVKVVTVGEPQQAVEKVTTSSTDIPAFTNRTLQRVAPTGEKDTDTPPPVGATNVTAAKSEFVENDDDERNVFVLAPTGTGGQLRRQCTQSWKIEPMRQWQTQELKRRGYAKTAGAVVSIQGISLDEAQRMRDSDVQWIVNEYPLVDKRMTRADCIRWLERNGLAVPPKSSCVFCPFQSLESWRKLKQNGGKDWEIAVDIDDKIRKVRPPFDLFVHPARKPLGEAVVVAADFGLEQGGLFVEDGDTGGCDSGHCFV